MSRKAGTRHTQPNRMLLTGGCSTHQRGPRSDESCNASASIGWRVDTAE